MGDQKRSIEENEELKEISRLYGDRTKTPKEEWIKYEGPEAFYELIMEAKKKKGLKFKDEK